ncbi:hypothetical protein N431DRAFT_97007 [Stipitochalara longipes BDJ]|nr:hypothetical protein N431DRAFT_97007 [Stipitochalara longipes BDJ]
MLPSLISPICGFSISARPRKPRRVGRAPSVPIAASSLQSRNCGTTRPRAMANSWTQGRMISRSSERNMRGRVPRRGMVALSQQAAHRAAFSPPQATASLARRGGDRLFKYSRCEPHTNLLQNYEEQFAASCTPPKRDQSTSARIFNTAPGQEGLGAYRASSACSFNVGHRRVGHKHASLQCRRRHAGHQ